MSAPRKGVIQISEVANGIIDPVLARRAGITTALLGSWDEIAGANFADCSRPEKIAWPRRGDPGNEGVNGARCDRAGRRQDALQRKGTRRASAPDPHPAQSPA